MIVKHNKTGNQYLIISDECKVKINGKWVDAVIYQGRDNETGKTRYFVREKSDFDSHFIKAEIIEPDLNDLWMAYIISVLKAIAKEYPGKTIEIIITQMEARWKEVKDAH